MAADAAPQPQRSSASSPTPASDAFSSGYDVFLVNGTIDDDLFGQIIRQVPAAPGKRVIVYLVTYGGLPNSAYRIGRYFQNVYEEFVAVVPSTCKSAGTLVLTAAHKVLMSDFGQIGPLDVQLRQRDELTGARSGLVTRSALNDLTDQTFKMFEQFVLGITQASGAAVSFRLAAEIAASVSAQCMSNIFEKINPEALGQDVRDLNVATEYAERLSDRSRNMKPDAISRLVHAYPSHDFVIDLEEARSLFNSIDRPTPALMKHIFDNPAEMMRPLLKEKFVKLLAAAHVCTVRPGPAATQSAPQDETSSTGEAAHEPQTQPDASSRAADGSSSSETSTG